MSKINIYLSMIIILFSKIAFCEKEKWFNEVYGYSTNDPKNGYAGSGGKAITAFYLCGGRRYRVHYLGDNKDSWTGEYYGCDEPVGIGRKIDAIAISGGYNYRIRYFKGNWEKPVNGYNIYDSRNGYAGTLGKPIDAIMVDGGNIYRVAYGDESSNVEQVSKRVTKNLFGISLNYNFNYETTIIDNNVAKVTVILTHRFSRSGNGIINLVVNDGSISDINIGKIDLINKINEILGGKLNLAKMNIKKSFSNGMNNGEIQINTYWFEKRIEFIAGSKITHDYYSFRGGYKINIYLKDNNNDIGNNAFKAFNYIPVIKNTINGLKELFKKSIYNTIGLLIKMFPQLVMTIEYVGFMIVISSIIVI